MAAPQNHRLEDTSKARDGVDQSSGDPTAARWSSFSAKALTSPQSQSTFAAERERTQNEVDHERVGLPRVQVAENEFSKNPTVQFPNPFVEKSYNGFHVEAQSYGKQPQTYENPFDSARKTSPPQAVEKIQPAPAPQSDRPSTDVRPQVETPAKTFEYRLHNGSGQHKAPDAVVRVGENFDPSKPVNLVVYNHGFGDTASSAYVNADLDKQLKNAPPNTVLVVPEWQANPAARSSADGRFSEPGRFKNMVEEAFSRTPGLQGETMKNVDSIHIISHSAGYKAVESELYRNGLENKVKSITMLDSMYNPSDLDPWLKRNIHALADGSKQFYNISNQGPHNTFAASYAQANRIKNWLNEARLSQAGMYEDYKQSGSIVGAEKFQNHSIVFKKSDRTVAGKGAHMSLPNLYVGRVLEAEN